MFDWNDLRYFLAIARGGSIGNAAKALGVNQSTVQRRLRALETALDCSLAERQAGGYQLTAHGQKLLAHAEQVETTVSTLQRQSTTLDNRTTGLVKLTSHVTVGQRIIKSGFLDRFHSGHPGITVELIMEQRALDLSRGQADIAIRGGTLDDDLALVGRKITEVPWGIYASRAFVERHGRPSTPADLVGFSIVELVDEIEALPAARWMKTHAPSARIAARCSNIPSVHLAIKSGAGIAPLPAVYAAADDELVCVLGPLPELDYPMFLLTHRDLRKIPRINGVFEFCLSELKSVLMRGEMKKSETSTSVVGP
ncbi:LysR family transcriptional regulator [Bradyrhizobium sp. F1.13.3]|uniref:LysR family transcriptional regulator n=1 Tax=Bradyrhizobium sp. F1.13.3 TaxID=3156351 RepID=UPI00339500A6